MPLKELFAVAALIWWLMLSIADVVDTFFLTVVGSQCSTCHNTRIS